MFCKWGGVLLKFDANGLLLLFNSSDALESNVEHKKCLIIQFCYYYQLPDSNLIILQE